MDRCQVRVPWTVPASDARRADLAGANALRRSTMESMTTKLGRGACLMTIALATTGCSGLLHGVRAVDPRLYTEPPRNAVTFWGHACAYVDVNGYGIVTDPVFQPGYAILRPRRIPA